MWENLLNLLFSWRVSGESWALRVYIQSLLYGSEYNRLTSEDNTQLTCMEFFKKAFSCSSESVFCSISPHSSHVGVSLPFQTDEGTNTDSSATYQTLVCTPSSQHLGWVAGVLVYCSQSRSYTLMKKLAAT